MNDEALEDKLISEEEFFLLYDANKSIKLDRHKQTLTYHQGEKNDYFISVFDQIDLNSLKE